MRCEMTCLSPGTLASSSSMVAEQLSSLVMRASNQPRERETGSVFERDPMRRRMAQLHPGTRVRVPINTARLNSHKKGFDYLNTVPLTLFEKREGKSSKVPIPCRFMPSLEVLISEVYAKFRSAYLVGLCQV